MMLALAFSLVAPSAHARPVEVRAQAIRADAVAASLCPLDAANAAREPLLLADPRAPETAGLQQAYDRVVAEWAVCARVNQVPLWGVPHIEDPAAQQLFAASLTMPGSRVRQEAIEAAAPSLPYGAALLALEELSVLKVVEQVPPPDRLALAAAAVGSWGCGPALAWDTDASGDQHGYCTDGRSIDHMATAGMQRLMALAAPTTQDSPHWLAQTTRARSTAWWNEAEAPWYPLLESLPQRLPEDGVGEALDPNLGWSGTLTADLVAWQERPAFRITQQGIHILQPGLYTHAPRRWDGAPVLYIDGDTPLATIDMALRDSRAARPVFVAQRKGSMNPEDLVELHILWEPDAVPFSDAAVVEVPALGGNLSHMRSLVEQSPTEGPTWLRAEPGLHYRDLVQALGAVAGIRHGPVIVSLAGQR